MHNSSSDHTLHRICSYCDYSRLDSEERTEARKILTCGRCYSTFYCSEDCQKKDWRALHKHHCTDGSSSKYLREGLGPLFQKYQVPFMQAIYHQKHGRGVMILDPSSGEIEFKKADELIEEKYNELKVRLSRHDPEKSMVVLMPSQGSMNIYILTSKAYRQQFNQDLSDTKPVDAN